MDFSIDRESIVHQNDETFQDIIKGLHYVELEYRRRTNHDFGFGSPSETYPLLERFVDRNPTAAKALWSWISDNGGNYYIPRCGLLTSDERAEKYKQERLEIDRRRAARKLARSEDVLLKLRAHQAKVQLDRSHLDRIQQMDAISLLSQLVPRPIYFYASALESIRIVSADEHELLLEVIRIQQKMEPTRERGKLLKRLRGLLNFFESAKE